MTALNGTFVGALVSPGPAAELAAAAQDFDWLIGGWTAEVRDVDADGQVREGSGEWWFAWVLEGRAIQDVWISPPRHERDKPRKPAAANDRYGSTIRYFDRDAGLWRITWINPVSGVENRLAGRRDGDRIVLEGEDDGHAIRWGFHEIKSTSFVWIGETRGADDRWIRQAEFRLRRLN